MKTEQTNTTRQIKNKVLFDNNKKVLLQIGKYFFELHLVKELKEKDRFKELKNLIDSNKYKLELLKE